MSRNFSKMSPTQDNIYNSIVYITGQQPYFNMPSIPDRLLSQEQILANYKVFDQIENGAQTTFFSSNNFVDDTFAVAFCAGASNFLRANGFPDNYLYNITIKDLKHIATLLPYNVNIDFTSQITSPPVYTKVPVYQPTQAPVYQPTQSPPVYQPTQAPPVYQPTQAPQDQKDDKDDTLKKVYISLLSGCILFIISMPFIYDKSNLIIAFDFLVCFLVSFLSVFLYYKLR